MEMDSKALKGNKKTIESPMSKKKTRIFVTIWKNRFLLISYVPSHTVMTF